MAKKNVNVEVKLRDREQTHRLIKRFLNKVKKEKIIEEVKNREFYEKPSEIRSRLKARRKKVLAKLRREKDASENFGANKNSQSN